MPWLQWMAIAGAVLALLAVAAAAYGSRRWNRSTRALVARLQAARLPPTVARYNASEIAGLPAPVQRFFQAVLVDGQPIVTAVSLEQSGSMDMSEGMPRWLPFTATQRVVTQRPGFVWDARFALLPGLAVRVHDAYAAGAGLLRGAVCGLIQVVRMDDSPELARGELLRFFAECAWYPTALLPSQGVHWEAVDDNSARATLSDGASRVTLTFRFHADGPIDSVRAEARGRTVGGATVATPWQGRFWNYATRGGMRVPLEGEVAWVLPAGARPYWRGTTTALAHEFAPTDLLLDPSTADAAEVAKALAADIGAGLSSQEAARRLAEQGPNELRGAPPTPAWRRFLSHFQDPLVYLLLAAIAVALLAWLAEGRHGWPVDALVIAAVVVANAVLGYLQQAKAADEVAALARMTEATSAVMRDGRVRRIPSTQLVRGDLLVLGEGDAVGADARLLEATSLRVQEASLTGESLAVLKNAQTLAAPAQLGDRRCMVFKGTAVAQGTGRAVVTATGMETQVGSIAHLLETTADKPTPLQLEVASIGRMLGAAVVVIAVVVVATVLLLSEIHGIADVVAVLLLGVALAVAAVPEGLPAILSLVLAIGVQRMARHNAIVTRLSSVETLGCASVICSDKTGTLTRSEMTIERVATASGSVHVTGVGYAPVGRFEREGALLSPGPLHSEQVVVLSGGSLAGNADLRQGRAGLWEIHGDPTEAAFLVAERKLGATERREQRFERIGDIPFTSERKMMSTIAIDREHGGQLVVIAKGAPDVLLKRCTRARVGMETVELDAARRAAFLADVDALSDAALRTLAVAYRPLDAGEDPKAIDTLERDLVFVGTVGIIDPPREEAAAAIREARRAGIRVVMITGDHPRTAARIAADLGIVAPGGAALAGHEIDALDEPAFRAAVRTTSVYARVAPSHKLRIVQALQADGNVVAMTGDGVNDAPALKAADIGIAMGITGTEVTKEAARMILADDNFATIVEAVREGRGILENIRKFLRYLLSSNMGEVLTVFLGVVGAGVIGLRGEAGAVVLPLLATQLLWVNLVTDAGPALALGVDPFTDDLMARKPRRPDERLIDARMWSSVIQTGLVTALVTLLTIDLFLPGGLIEGTSDLATARTAGFNVLVFTSLFACLSARSDTSSAFRSLFANPWLWGALGLSAVLQVAVIHLPVLNIAFGTVPLTPQQWAICAGMGSGVLWYSELRKMVLRARG